MMVDEELKHKIELFNGHKDVELYIGETSGINRCVSKYVQFSPCLHLFWATICTIGLAAQENGSSPIWPKSKQSAAAKQMAKGGKYMKKKGLSWAGAAATSALKRWAIKPPFPMQPGEIGKEEIARRRGQWQQKGRELSRRGVFSIGG
ncbi:hypothetical protein Taro_004182 [Colocasia esculenta]|uniref:Uncharacterized protein n=1 Tax=Colocasia esculenta TaxID=4460 RepID=A0A843TNQ8_COLES|nr:hypothetical protein [Colocasia esculenta]